MDMGREDYDRCVRACEKAAKMLWMLSKWTYKEILECIEDSEREILAAAQPELELDNRLNDLKGDIQSNLARAFREGLIDDEQFKAGVNKVQEMAFYDDIGSGATREHFFKDLKDELSERVRVGDPMKNLDSILDSYKEMISSFEKVAKHRSNDLNLSPLQKLAKDNIVKRQAQLLKKPDPLKDLFERVR